MSYSPSSSSSHGLQHHYWTAPSSHPYRTAINGAGPSFSNGSSSHLHESRQHPASQSALWEPKATSSSALNSSYAQAPDFSNHVYRNSQPPPDSVQDAGISQAGWSRQPVASQQSRLSRSDRLTDLDTPTGRGRSATLSSSLAPHEARYNGSGRNGYSTYAAEAWPSTSERLQGTGSIDANSSHPSSAAQWPTLGATTGMLNQESGAAPVSANTRNFLIPIGDTGARQKLSILSASQRPRTSHPSSHKVALEDCNSNASAQGRQIGRWTDSSRGEQDALELNAEARRPGTVNRSWTSPLMQDMPAADANGFSRLENDPLQESEALRQNNNVRPRSQPVQAELPPQRPSASDYNFSNAGNEDYESHSYSSRRQTTARGDAPRRPTTSPLRPTTSPQRELGSQAGRTASSTSARAQTATSSGRPGAWKTGLKNMFSRPSKEQRGSSAYEDTSPNLRGGSIDDVDRRGSSRLHSDARRSPNSKAYAILGEVPPGLAAHEPPDANAISSMRSTPTRMDNLDEIAKAGWTAYTPQQSPADHILSGSSHATPTRPRRTLPPSHGVYPNGGQHSASSTALDHLPRSSSASSIRPIEASSSWSRSDSRASSMSQGGSWFQSSPASARTATPEAERSESAAKLNASRSRPPLSGAATYIPRPPAHFLAQANSSSAKSKVGATDTEQVALDSILPSNRPRQGSGTPEAFYPGPSHDESLATRSDASTPTASKPPSPPVLQRLSGDESSDSTQRRGSPTSSPAVSSDKSVISRSGSAGNLSAAERSIVPLTSPLLASVLHRQQQDSGSASMKMGSIDSSNGTRGQSETAQIQFANRTSLSKAAPKAVVIGGNTMDDRSPPTADSASPASGPLSRADEFDPKTFVPADALKTTRKGVPVQQLAKAPADDSLKSLDNSAGMLTFSELSGSVEDLSSGLRQPTPRGQQDSTKGNDADRSMTFDEATSVDTVNLLPASAWTEVETALMRFKVLQPQNASDKGALLRTVLLPFLALEAETPDVEVTGAGPFREGKARRRLFFDWIRSLLAELRTIQTSADRGAILESIACIVESRNFGAALLETDAEDQNAFFNALSHIINYAIGELNKKGVYQNTLIFSGRLLAVAFFRIEGVASKLLRSLPVNRFAVGRVEAEAEWTKHRPENFDTFRNRFPPWLREFCFESAQSYLKTLDAQSGQSEEEDRFLVRQASIEVEMSGNWLRRWQSDDSELFFSFCRSYHRQLSSLLSGRKVTAKSPDRRPFFGGPGYAHLATCIHQKCLSLVHRDILSVTTLSSQKNFNPGETANVLSGSTAGKPRHLEAANRRCTAIIVDIVRSSPASAPESSLFASMPGLHVKCLVKRTSLFDVQGVFCLLDWVDGVLVHMENAEMNVKSFVDIGFLLETIAMLLKDADHALALMRTIAFCYSNFAVLTSASEYRTQFLEKTLLDPFIFKKLFLSWSYTIRAYFLHLLVFRLARINDFQVEDDPKGKTAIRVVKLFNQRLDEIRRRHDEFSPPHSAGSQSEDEDEIAKNRRASFVSTIKRTPSVHQADLSPVSASKAERILGIGSPEAGGIGMSGGRSGDKAPSRAAKWFRSLGGKGGKQTRKDGSDGPQSGPQVSGLGLYTEGPHGLGSHNLPGQSSSESMERRGPLSRLDELDASTDSADEPATISEDSQGDDEAMGLAQASFGGSDQINRSTPNGSANPLADGVAPSSSGEHLAEDVSFDLQNAGNNALPINGQSNDGLGTDQGASWAPSHSPQRVSRAFSRRRSMLPEHARSLVAAEGNSASDENFSSHDSTVHGATDGPLQGGKAGKNVPEADASQTSGNTTAAYDRHLHIYAVQSLREYEQTVQEHDDFFATQPQSAGTPQVPRLPIQWPAMWSE